VVGLLRRRVAAGRADTHRFAGDRDVVLDRDWDAGQWQRLLVLAGVDGVGLVQGLEDAHLLERADPAVALLDAFEGVFGRSAGGELAGANGGRDLGGGLGHPRTLPAPRQLGRR